MTPTRVLRVLSAGAAQGLIQALAPTLLASDGASITGRFGAVGAMKEAFDAGEPCDLIVLTDAMITAMTADGTALAASRAPLGVVKTGVAVKSGAPHPDVSTPQALARALEAADSIYVPDLQRSTAGQHFERVLRELGLLAPLGPRLRPFANGATAMRELALTGSPASIGCTQVTEILFTPGVDLVARLPDRFELATIYSAAIAARAVEPERARRFMDRLIHADQAPLRARCGFEALAAE
jgi:molybdate transport system substrate-binding protein